jgi:hypothetical protein
MMNTRFQTATDFLKSLETRLRARSSAAGEDVQRLRRKVAFDRLLARIFSNKDAGLYLKGGYAMELRVAHARATKDIDLTSIRHYYDETDCFNELIRRDLQSFSQIDLQDYFIYHVSEAQATIDNAPYGGSRYLVTCSVGEKIFARFHLDVGQDFLLDEIEMGYSLPHHGH